MNVLLFIVVYFASYVFWFSEISDEEGLEYLAQADQKTTNESQVLKLDYLQASLLGITYLIFELHNYVDTEG